jgi:hypothetical protein
MNDISRLRCFNHSTREAVALCPQCSHPFCRECITEHEDRVLCARCLAALEKAPGKRPARIASVLRGSSGLLSFIMLWAVFYYFGKILLKIPSSFHESIFKWTF